jgi:hypothetical protein
LKSLRMRKKKKKLVWRESLKYSPKPYEWKRNQGGGVKDDYNHMVLKELVFLKEQKWRNALKVIMGRKKNAFISWALDTWL